MKELFMILSILNSVNGYDHVEYPSNEQEEQACYQQGGMIDQDGHCDMEYAEERWKEINETYKPTMSIKEYL